MKFSALSAIQLSQLAVALTELLTQNADCRDLELALQFLLLLRDNVQLALVKERTNK
jgi:hypothetical protein